MVAGTALFSCQPPSESSACVPAIVLFSSRSSSIIRCKVKQRPRCTPLVAEALEHWLHLPQIGWFPLVSTVLMLSCRLAISAMSSAKTYAKR